MYRLTQQLVMSRERLEWYVRTHLRPRLGDRVLDIGCGPADILEFLPDVEYTGFDPSERYVKWAIARYGSRGRFLCQSVSADALVQLGEFDLVLANGVLHHLEDAEVRSLFRTAKALLAPAARLVTFDGCFTDRQNPIAAYLLSRDRGRYVRMPNAYLRLAREYFEDVSATIYDNLLRVPYSHVIMECQLS